MNPSSALAATTDSPTPSDRAPQVFRSLPELSTRIGGRDRNNDAATWALNTSNSGDPFVIAAIADGVGSPAGSGTAARAAVQTACAIGMHLDVRFEMAQLADATAETLRGVSAWTTTPTDVVVATMREFDDPDLAQGQPADTTFVGLTLDSDAEIRVCWLGDSRAYVLTAETRLVQLTDDHNRAAQGRPNVLTRSLGWRAHGGPETARWTSTAWPHRADRVLLCTDGVHGTLSNEVIRYALVNADTPTRAASWLTRWAVRAAGKYADNATALVIDVAPDPTQEP